MASDLPSSSEYRNASPCWLVVDNILRERLSVLHHSLGSDIVDPASAAEDFCKSLNCRQILNSIGCCYFHLFFTKNTPGKELPRTVEGYLSVYCKWLYIYIFVVIFLFCFSLPHPLMGLYYSICGSVHMSKDSPHLTNIIVLISDYDGFLSVQLLSPELWRGTNLVCTL